MVDESAQARPLTEMSASRSSPSSAIAESSAFAEGSNQHERSATILTTAPESVPSPSPESSTAPACPIDFRGRPLCPGAPPPHHPSFTERKSELADACQAFALWLFSSLMPNPHDVVRWLGPVGIFIIVLHALLAIQLFALIVEDQIVKIGMSNPMPPLFSSARVGRASSDQHRLTRGPLYWSKKFSHLRWRTKALLKRFGSMLAAMVMLLSVVSWIGWEAVAKGTLGVDSTPDWGSWVDVPLGRWLLEDVSGGERVHRRVRGGPLRALLVLEVSEGRLEGTAPLESRANADVSRQSIAGLLSLLQPLKHLLPASIMPSTSPAPIWLFPPTTLHTTMPSFSRARVQAANIRLSTSHLCSHLHDLLLSFTTLAQLLTLIIVLPSAHYSLFSLAPHAIFHATRGKLRAVEETRMTVARTRDRLALVFNMFPASETARQSDTPLKHEDATEDALEAWVCTICFEGREPHSDDSSSQSTSSDHEASSDPSALCQLPCGHRCECPGFTCVPCRADPYSVSSNRSRRLSDYMATSPSLLPHLSPECRTSRPSQRFRA